MTKIRINKNQGQDQDPDPDLEEKLTNLMNRTISL